MVDHTSYNPESQSAHGRWRRGGEGATLAALWFLTHDSLLSKNDWLNWLALHHFLLNHLSICQSVSQVSVCPSMRPCIFACRLCIQLKMAQAQHIQSIILWKLWPDVNRESEILWKKLHMHMQLMILAKIRVICISSSAHFSPPLASVFYEGKTTDYSQIKFVSHQKYTYQQMLSVS